MKSPLYELQKAIYQRLNGNITCPVYDAVPDGAVFPYVTIGEDTAIDWSTKAEAGQETTHTLHVWSQYPGMAEVKRITDEVIQTMTAAPLVMTGFKPVVSRLDFNQVLRDPDGKTRHGVIRFRFKIEEE